jgi:hypothetical protein
MLEKTCSLCGDKLVRGRVAVRKSLAAKLQWPFASDRLFFKPDGEGQGTETVIREGGSYEAFKCQGCQAVLITQNRWSAGT